ncbi:MAG: hypothetical protein U1F83_19840 [Verrucomicrobiota bacterium]
MSDPNLTSPAPKRRGCLFYGCLTAVVLLLLAGLLAFLAVRYVRNKLDAYTDTQPMKLPKVEMTDADYQKLQERVKSFGALMQEGKPGEPLLLNEREINALIARSEAGKAFADKVYVSVNGNEVKGQVSMPLSALGWLGKDRYLNGEAVFKVSLENGVLIVTAQSVKVKGTPLPESFMSQLRQENLAKDAYKDPKNAEAIRKLDSLQVEDDRVVIKARAAK